MGPSDDRVSDLDDPVVFLFHSLSLGVFLRLGSRPAQIPLPTLLLSGLAIQVTLLVSIITFFYAANSNCSEKVQIKALELKSYYTQYAL